MYTVRRGRIINFLVVILAFRLFPFCHLADRTHTANLWHTRMVMFLKVVATLAAFSTAAYQVFKPRLPVYSMQIMRFPTPSYTDGEFMTQIHAKVNMHNANFIGIDVHSLAIDMFYPTWYGELKHIGRVYDHKQQHRKPECLEDVACRKEKGLDEAIWALQPRADFEIKDIVYATVESNGIIKTFFTLVWNLIKSGGHLVIPTTGVMHVKASSTTPITMSMICDNSLNVFTLLMVGMECTLNSVNVGWIELDGAIDKLQNEVLSYLIANITGGVLESHKPRGSELGYEKMLKKLKIASIGA